MSLVFDVTTSIVVATVYLLMVHMKYVNDTHRPEASQ